MSPGCSSPRPPADRLLPGVGGIAGVQVQADLEAALGEAEVELLRRTRLLGDEDVADFATHRRECHDQLLPATVLFTDETISRQGSRLAAVAELGSRLGLGVVAVGLDGALPPACAWTSRDARAMSRPGPWLTPSARLFCIG